MILLPVLYRPFAVLLICATTVTAAPFPTNMDLLVETVASAVDVGLAEMDMPDDTAAAPLLLVPQSKHDANWMVDHLLSSKLLDRGGHLRRAQVILPHFVRQTGVGMATDVNGGQL